MMSKKTKTSEIKSDAEKYDKKTPREHILLRPGMYIGDVDQTKEMMWVYSDNKIVMKDITFTPGFLKIFDEGLINARDAAENDPTCTEVRIECNMEEGYISIMNNGDIGIPVEEHPEHKTLVPSMIFGELLTGSNYDDNIERTTGGMNGIGSKAINIFSKRFIVDIDDMKRNKRFHQEWKDNMLTAEKADVSKLPSKTKSSVKITFYPDFEKFHMKNLDSDHMMLFHRRAIDIAGTSHGKLKVYFNGTKIDVGNFKDYITLYLPQDSNELYYESTDRWTVGVVYRPDSNNMMVSFVNGISTYRGGTHCNYIMDMIIKSLIADIKKKEKDIKVTPALLKENLVFFINSIIVNPAFSSQTKDTLTTKADKFGSKYEPTPAFLKKLSKCGIIEQVIELAKFKENSSLKKTDGKKQVKISGIPKLEDANKAGTKESHRCTLILTEGDSAKATAMAGLGVVGRDYFGVFPLKGKMLNVREAAPAQLLANEEIKSLKLILGLKQGEDYTTQEKFNTLRYGHVLILVDQDPDGSHIKGLFMNMVHTLWPSLIKRPEFIQGLNTPIVKATKGKDVITFYNLSDYETWRETPAAHNYKVKYYKGLGTSTAMEAKEYFVDIDTKLINYFWENVDMEIKAKFSEEKISKEKISKEKNSKEKNSESEDDSDIDEDIFIPKHDDDDAIKLAFDKTRADDRKKWLMAYDRNNVLKNENKIIPYYDFIHYELIHFSNEDLIRSIPSVIDGLKPSQRKILYGAFLRGLDKDEVKVAQLAGFVSDRAAYHHGEMSLNGAIIGLAQNFVGSNNINILMPKGQFGCLDPKTPILMWDGTMKLAEDVKVKDQLIGDDGLVRNVLHITDGIDEMYKIETEHGQEYTVNSEHIITLYYKNNNIIKHKESNCIYYINYFDNKTIKAVSIKYNKDINVNNHFNKSKITKEEAYNFILNKQKEIKEKYNINKIIDIKIVDYMQLSAFSKKGLFMISNTNVIDWATKNVKIDPYILGAWLGDGNHEGNGITSADDEILKAFAIWADSINCELTHHTNGIRRKDSGYIISIGDKNHSSKTCEGCITSQKQSPICDWYFSKSSLKTYEEQSDLINDKNGVKMFYNTNPFKHLLKEMKLFKNKHIPNEYIYNDKNVRLQLLAGFIDTDGRVSKNVIEISQSKRLHENLIKELDFLCKTLGFVTSIYVTECGKTKKGEDITMLTLRIMGENIHEIPTKLPLKKINDIRNERKYAYYNYMNFTIKHIGLGPFNGWSLDGNERFLLGNFIVTHNSRHKGGSDAASPRYIWTMLDDLTTTIFNPMDDPVLKNQEEDAMPIEPEYYAPIIPMVLVNGAEGIGTGFSTKIPPYNPLEIIRNIRNIMKSKPYETMDPWWQGFEGIVNKTDDLNYEIYGMWNQDEDTITITELPVGVWTYNYKEFLEKLLEDPTPVKKDDKKKVVKKDNPFLGYKDNNTDTKVHFELTFEPGYLNGVKDIEKLLHLTKKYSNTNMHLYGPEGHIKRYETVEAIMRDYYNVRLELYQKRKKHMLDILEYQLKVISSKVRFILMVVEKKLDINNKKKVDIELLLEKNKFPMIGKNKDDTKLSYDYLLSMPIYSLSWEKIEELKELEKDKQSEYNILNGKTPEMIWSEELDILEAKYNKWYKKNLDEKNDSIGKKKKKNKK